MSYRVQSAHGSAFPVYLPAAFSATLGAGLAGRAPFRYVAPSAVAGLRAIKYKSVFIPWLATHRSTTSQLAAAISSTAYRAAAGRLPISQVASSSSAFLRLDEYSLFT